MEQALADREHVIFDYTAFLSVTSRNTLTLKEILNQVFEYIEDEEDSGNVEFEKRAYNLLSINVSDYNNVIRLIKLARTMRYQRITVQLPFAFETDEWQKIISQTECRIEYLDSIKENVNIYL